MEISTTNINNRLQDLFFEIFGSRFNFILSDSTECLPSQIPRIILYSLESEYDDKNSGERLFSNFVNQCARRKLITSPLDAALFGILHEIGHFYTWYCFSETDIKKHAKYVNMLQQKDELTKEDHYKYFKLPIELMATKFAINWALSNDAALIYLTDRFQAIIHDFYNEHHVVDTDDENK